MCLGRGIWLKTAETDLSLLRDSIKEKKLS